ncbi:uncharacterized protein LOC107874442 [Capsicum annuum]|uniref:uncharacterized protein LOC107874442 n=1 Tax=Capsicum annuum TaxID=4072 RepID=UPI0007BEBADA|nr:uncharacterized protein LOC107874442 [Capsicum annuum]
MAPPTFDGESYQIWAVRMRIYLQALDFWEAFEDEYEIALLSDNPMVAQIKTHKERKTRKSKALACLFTTVSSNIFTRIMSLESAKEVWDYLKTEYEGYERIRGMQVLNLVCEFELQRMKESETIKEYSDRLLNLANRIRLLGSAFNNSRIIEKILVTTPKRFEATITILENTKDLSKITLAELLSAFQAQEQQRVMRQGGAVEGALPAKHHDDRRSKKKENNKHQPTDGEGAAHSNKNKTGGFKRNYPPCKNYGKLGYAPFKCWERPDAKCAKYNKLGHEAIICKNKTQQQDTEARVVDEQEED